MFWLCRHAAAMADHPPAGQEVVYALKNLELRRCGIALSMWSRFDNHLIKSLVNRFLILISSASHKLQAEILARQGRGRVGGLRHKLQKLVGKLVKQIGKRRMAMELEISKS